MDRFVICFLCLSLIVLPASTQAQQSVGQSVLEARTVILSIRSSPGSFRCLGFRIYREDFPPAVELVLTAAHCITEPDIKSILVAARDGQRSYARHWLRWSDYDVAFLLSAPGLGPVVPVRGYWRQPPTKLPVLAMIVVGGGKPTMTSGLVQGLSGYNVQLLMPAAPGSSGGAVVDTSGRLVGLISRGSGPVDMPNSAGLSIRTVGADLVMRLLGAQQQRLLAWATELSR